MIRAIGFGADEVKDMIKIEGAMYGIAASLVGGTVGLVLMLLLYNAINKLCKFNVLMVIIACVVTVIVTTISSLISSRILFKKSIVDSIRSV